MVADTRPLRQWARDSLPGKFNFGKRPWPVELLVLAAAGHDIRLVGDVAHCDGNPLNCKIANLLAPGPGAVEREFDRLLPLAAVPELPTREGLLPYLRTVLRDLLGRFDQLRLQVKLKVGRTAPDASSPYFEASATVEASDAQGAVQTSSAIGAGLNPLDATFAAELEALRRLLFFGLTVPYCGVLLARGRLVVELVPIDLITGKYRLILTYDSSPSRGWWDVSNPNSPIPTLPRPRYEFDVRPEAPGKKHRTPYLRILGPIPADLRAALAHLIDLRAAPVRVHRLVAALGGRILLGDADPADPSSKVHVHHRVAQGHFNHFALLGPVKAADHAQQHFEWSTLLGETPKSRRAATWVSLRERNIRSEWFYDQTEHYRHTVVSTALANFGTRKTGRLRRSANDRWVADRVRSELSPGPGKAAQDRVVKGAMRLISAISNAGGAMPTEELFRLTLIPRSSGYRWLRRLHEGGLVMLDKEGKQSTVRLMTPVPDPVPQPRSAKPKRASRSGDGVTGHGRSGKDPHVR